MTQLEEMIHRIGIVPVIKLTNPQQDAQPLSDALCAGGVPIAEITFRATGAEKAIRIMAESHPDMLVGAGTVLSCQQVDMAIEAGGKFIVTPGFDEEIVRYCQKNGIAVFPGCTTPTDYHTAYRYGLKVLKFFPAEQSGGLEKIRAMAAPFPMFRIMPTGGISLKNLGQYAADPTILACGGSYMVTADLIQKGNWNEITALCKQSVNIVKEARK